MATNEDVSTARPNRWRPVSAGTAFFIGVFTLNVFVEDGVTYFGVTRSTVVGSGAAWIIWLLYRNNILKKDVLTGLNRRLVAEEKLEQLRLAKRDVTVAIIDVNGLRTVNNNDGHEAGDRLLKEVSHRLSAHFSMGRIIVARLGGDEFIVVAEHKSPQDLCNELTRCLSKAHDFGDWPIAAAGVARSRCGKVRDAFRCADMAMYRAKKTNADHALQYDCVLDGIPPATLDSERPTNRLRDEAI